MFFCVLDISWTTMEFIAGGINELIKLPVNVSVQGLTPAKRLEVPKSEIFKTPL